MEEAKFQVVSALESIRVKALNKEAESIAAKVKDVLGEEDNLLFAFIVNSQNSMTLYPMDETGIRMVYELPDPEDDFEHFIKDLGL